MRASAWLEHSANWQHVSHSWYGPSFRPRQLKMPSGPVIHTAAVVASSVCVTVPLPVFAPAALFVCGSAPTEK